MQFGRIVYCISGFMQDRHSTHGIDAIWWNLMDGVSKEFFPSVYRWNDSMKAAAQLAIRRGGPDTEIGIVAYSWGAGYAAMNLCHELRRWNRKVDKVMLIDPVYRSKLMTFRWLAFTKWKITVPDNVRQVGYWRQSNAGPVGSRLKTYGNTEVLFEKDVSRSGLDHWTIQHDQDIHDEVLVQMRSDWGWGVAELGPFAHCVLARP